MFSIWSEISRVHSDEEEAELPLSMQAEMTLKRKRVQVEAEAGGCTQRDDADSNDDDSESPINITEAHYRELLSEQLHKHKKMCLTDAVAARCIASVADVADELKQSGEDDFWASTGDTGPFFDPQRAGFSPFETEYSTGTSNGDGHILDLGGGVKFLIPPHYEQVSQSLNLPDVAATTIDESFLSTPVTSKTLKSLLTAEANNRGGTEVRKCSKLVKKFPLQVNSPVTTVKQVLNCTVSTATRQDFAGSSGQKDIRVLERGDGFEVIQRRIQKKKSVRKDSDVVAREDVEKVAKFWINLVRRDLPKHYKSFISYHKKQAQESKRIAESCQREVKSRNVRIIKTMKAAPGRNRKLAKEMILFWKKLDKEQAEVRKREEKDAAEALKRDEEFREARRQQQRLNFLLTQTELYSHFMQNKISGSKLTANEPELPMSNEPNLEDTEDAVLKAEALEAAKKAAFEQKQKITSFDDEILKLRESTSDETGEDVEDSKEREEREEIEEREDMDLLHPSTMPITSSVSQPTLFHGNLKEYQLKGLQWLVNCYEQGLNGILADEMGLGKTIQATAFLAHLAEEKNIWGPFLVVAPASVLNNWADEVNRFCPDLKILPYWGGLQERTVLRKSINPKRLYRRDSGFHILITSYQLLVSDEKYFRRVKWQYMILDEAQAIKSATSLRWKTFRSFNCRNRLLLTGTPIQNNMAELWALLHFIMPTLFDSHEQFNEWFSKGIENHAEHGGTLNEHQLNRLHAILKPFMLRRVKKDVVSELTNKKEVIISCILSSRQQAIYQAVKNKISIADLFDGAHVNGKKVVNLMNIVIQLRKVCNHPELFERNESHTYLHFATGLNQQLVSPPFGELEDIYYSGGHNLVSYKIPKLLFRDGMHSLPSSSSGAPQGFRDKWISSMLNIYSEVNVHKSIFEHQMSGAFGFTRLTDLSPSEVTFLSRSSLLERWEFDLSQSDRRSILKLENETLDEDPRTKAVRRMLLLPLRSDVDILMKKFPSGPPSAPFESLIVPFEERLIGSIRLLRSVRAFMPVVLAPQVAVTCSDRGFVYQRAEQLHNPHMKRLLVGFARTSEYNGPALPSPSHYRIKEVDERFNGRNSLMSTMFQIFGSAPPLQSFDFARTLMDSGKLQALDGLLRRLRAGNHRVLVFAQMTKMLDILEDYMIYRKYKYFRLDGSSALMDRRDMVKDFQHRSDVFVFLLSTRAGGLGINLTAADTVIFYESDWNPTMDLQAMDRAHRLGQTKEVTVYRLICKGSVEEKIVRRASQKNTVQQLVMTGGQSEDVFEADEVVSLLLDDAELENRMKHQSNEQDKQKRKKGFGVGGGASSSSSSSKKVVQIDADGVVSLHDETASALALENLEEKATPPSRRRSGQKAKHRETG